MMPGRSGQYEIVVDGETIASRKGGFVKRLLGGGWPDNEDILNKLQQRQEGLHTA